jgi:NTP pyrophosphatase (non-canonical NTP hydrolase)
MVRQDRISLFNQRHDVDEDSQFKQLMEEIGELAEALNRDADDKEVAEELGDVVFVATSIADLRGLSIEGATESVTKTNLMKNLERDGNKITKSTDGGNERMLKPDGTPVAPYPKCDRCHEYHIPSNGCYEKVGDDEDDDEPTFVEIAGYQWPTEDLFLIRADGEITGKAGYYVATPDTYNAPSHAWDTSQNTQCPFDIGVAHWHFAEDIPDEVRMEHEITMEELQAEYPVVEEVDGDDDDERTHVPTELDECQWWGDNV